MPARPQAIFFAVAASVLFGIPHPVGALITADLSRIIGAPDITNVADKKRAAPSPIEPVTIDGIRYEAIQFGKARGLEQNGGYIAAIDAKTGTELWLVKIYEVRYDGDMEPDKQDIFISAMQLTRDQAHVEIENEAGARFRLDLKTHQVQRVN